MENNYDIREENCIFRHNKFSEINDDYEIIEYILRHILKMGVDPGYMKNSIQVVNNRKETFNLIYCETNGFIKLCGKSFEIIKNLKQIMV